MIVATAGAALVATCRIAESSVRCTLDPRSTVCGLVRDWRRRTARVTPAETAPLTIAAITTSATTAPARRLPAGASGGDSAPSGSITGASLFGIGIPGEDQLAVVREARFLIERDCRLILGAGPDITECHPPPFEELHGCHQQPPPDSLPPGVGTHLAPPPPPPQPRPGLQESA